jgi:hypothetical protein
LASDFAAIGIVGDVSVSSTKRRITRSLEAGDALEPCGRTVIYL